MRDDFIDAEPEGRDATVLRITNAIADIDVATDGLRLRLSKADRRVVAQANVRAAHRPARVQVAADTLREAVDDLIERLGRRILECATGWSPQPWPDTDDASVPSRVPPGERAPGLGLLARTKSVPLAMCPPEVAVTAMDLMDYPAHLFIDADSGLDSIVYRAGPTGYRLARIRPAAPPAGNVIPLTVDPHPAPALQVEQAMIRLDRTGLGHLFFTDPDTGRGRLLHRRFDSRYSLLKEGR